MSEYIIDTTKAEQEYAVTAEQYLSNFTHVMGCPLKEQIIRCKDCKNFNGLLVACFRGGNLMKADPEGFCAWAERKEESE